MIKERNFHFINGFILKIIAIVLMTLDHIGMFLLTRENTVQIGIIFRDFGRIALPLFLFLIVEGVRHTKHFGKYFLRLSIVATIFLIGQLVVYYNFDNQISDFYSPILDLLVVALTIYLLKRKDRFSFLALLPICFSILSFVVVNIEKANDITILWLPFYLRLPYSLLDVLLGISFFYSSELAVLFLKSNQNTENLVETKYLKWAEYIISAFAVIFFVLIFYVIYLSTGVSYWSDSSQAFAAFAFIPLLLYSGERGYNKKWFQYGAYIYTPLHLLIIYLIFTLI